MSQPPPPPPPGPGHGEPNQPGQPGQPGQPDGGYSYTYGEQSQWDGQNAPAPGHGVPEQGGSGQGGEGQPKLMPWQRPDGDASIPIAAPAPMEQGRPSGQSFYGVRSEQPQQQDAAGYQQFTFPQMQKAKVEPLAVTGIATSPLGIPGLALGLLSLPRVKGGRRRSPALAWTAVILGSVFSIGWILTIITLSLTGAFDRYFESPQAGDVTEARTIASANLAEGNCIATLPPARPVGEVRQVPCETSHIAQVISIHELDGEFPGDDDLEAQARELCAADVAGLGDTPAPVESWYLTPTGEGWSQGNTQLVCLARGSAGPFEGDLLG